MAIVVVGQTKGSYESQLHNAEKAFSTTDERLNLFVGPTILVETGKEVNGRQQVNSCIRADVFLVSFVQFNFKSHSLTAGVVCS